MAPQLFVHWPSAQVGYPWFVRVHGSVDMAECLLACRVGRRGTGNRMRT